MKIEHLRNKMEVVRKGEIHPLQNSSILDVIFKGLELDDLKTCRLVCQEWCSVSTTAMEKVSSVVKIADVNGKRISEFFELVRVEEGDQSVFFSVPRFMKRFKISSLKSDFFTLTFWRVCGWNIKAICLYDVVFESADVFRQTVLASSPNMKKLSMFFVTVAGESKEKTLTTTQTRQTYLPNRNLTCLKIGNIKLGGVSWNEILDQFPALQNFEVGYGVSDLTALVESLALARSNNDQVLNIKDLHFNMGDIHTPHSTVGQALGNLRLPLGRLCMSGFGADDAISVQKYLALNVHLLTDLSLIGGFHSRIPIGELIHLPRAGVFKNVTTLKLKHIDLQSVTFLRWFPNLKMLDFSCSFHQSDFLDVNAGNWTLQSCTELQISSDKFRPDDFRQLISKLPNVETLTVLLGTNNDLQIIFELLPKVVSLVMVLCKIDDVLISGLDEEDVKMINKAGEEGKFWPITVAKPNLGSLTNLKRLGIDDSQTELGYTTAAIVDSLPHLEELGLWDCLKLHPVLCNLETRLPWNPCNK